MPDSLPFIDDNPSLLDRVMTTRDPVGDALKGYSKNKKRPEPVAETQKPEEKKPG